MSISKVGAIADGAVSGAIMGDGLEILQVLRWPKHGILAFTAWRLSKMHPR